MDLHLRNQSSDLLYVLVINVTRQEGESSKLHAVKENGELRIPVKAGMVLYTMDSIEQALRFSQAFESFKKVYDFLVANPLPPASW